jgi:hypothetical protein
MTGLKSDIRNAVGALYGNTVLPERPGYAHGPYEYDVSPYLAESSSTRVRAARSRVQ